MIFPTVGGTLVPPYPLLIEEPSEGGVRGTVGSLISLNRQINKSYKCWESHHY